MNSDKLFATIVTASTILLLILISIWIFAKSSSSDTFKHFVSKQGEAIAVSLASPPSSAVKKVHNIKHSKKSKHKRKQKKRKKVAKKSKRVIKKDTTKKSNIAKRSSKKVAKKTTTKNSTPKKIETKKLFSSISQTNSVNKNSKAKNPGEGRGEINRYLAKIENRLRGWPAQRNFAGEEIDVRLKIYPTGKFEYKIMKYSQNEEFNRALVEYLDDLKRFGFGLHKGGRAYEIEVKFIAHD